MRRIMKGKRKKEVVSSEGDLAGPDGVLPLPGLLRHVLDPGGDRHPQQQPHPRDGEERADVPDVE